MAAYGVAPCRMRRFIASAIALVDALVERPAGVGVLDDLGLRIAGFLDDRVAVVPLDDRFGLEDLMSVDDREPARIRPQALVLLARELDELVAAQSPALAHEREQARRVLAELHPLVDLAEGRLIHGDALAAFTSHG